MDGSILCDNRFCGYLFRNKTEIKNWETLLIFIPLLLLAISSESMSKGIMKKLMPYNILDFVCKTVSFVLLELPIATQTNAKFWIWVTVITGILFVISVIMNILMHRLSQKYDDDILPVNTNYNLSIINYFIKSIVLAFILFFMQLFFLIKYTEWIEKFDVANCWVFLIFVWLLVLAFSAFEIKGVTENNQRFLGWKAYFIFYYKLLYIIINVFLTVFLTSGNLITIAVIINVVLIILYGSVIAFNLFKYKSKWSKQVTIDYRSKINEWYIESEV